MELPTRPRCRRRHGHALRHAAGVAALLVTAFAQADGADTGALKKLSVEELLDLDVTSVTKTAEHLSAAPAAIYVITHDDAVRSGATSLPEVLRLAPNLHVVQISASNYTITARGFSGNSSAQNFSDKLLVLIDGRSVYSPLYSGVYWNAQDVLIDDIDRVEVISGPGATLWGANAVNGVINIITRTSADTQGGTASAAGGTFEKNASLQYGGLLGEDATFRVYGKGFERASLDAPSGGSSDDGWSSGQVGFRTDWARGTDRVTVQGDAYRTLQDEPGTSAGLVSGVNLVARWQRQLASDSALQVQVFYDQTEQFNGGGNGAFVLNTYDFDVQHSFSLASRNEIVWGVGDRVSRYGITNTASLLFVPDHRQLNLVNAFVQDVIALRPGLKLTLGIKVEDDPYTGTTPLPSARLAWTPTERTMLWSAVSRAIRSATPFDRDVHEYIGQTLFLVGGPDFQPERVTAYEVGFRGAPVSGIAVSISAYYNVYDDLRSLELDPVTFLPLQWGNMMKGNTYGVELWTSYQATDAWRLAFTYNEMREDLRFKAGSSQLLGVAQAGDDPKRQASLRSSLTIATDWTLDANLRYVGALPDPAVHAYGELNARLGWRVSRTWELALSGSNLLHAHHEEFTVPPSDAIGRTAILDARVRF